VTKKEGAETSVKRNRSRHQKKKRMFLIIKKRKGRDFSGTIKAGKGEGRDVPVIRKKTVVERLKTIIDPLESRKRRGGKAS